MNQGNEKEQVQVEDSGYVQDVAFRSGVVTGQSPAVMRYVSLLNGFVPEVPRTRFTYCDLGCGEGVTTLALAALYPESRFYGVDFNPEHIAQARNEADQLGLGNASFIEASFSKLESLDLPLMDYIGCNGIYGWLDPENRQAVDDFAGSSLNPGGLFYVEYLSMPGKAAIAAIRKFIQAMVPPREDGDPRARAEEGIKMLEILAKRGMGFFSQNPAAVKAARNYILGKKRDEYRIDHFAHNAMARWFEPMYFTEMHTRMIAKGLSFAGRTDLFANDLELCVPPSQVPTFLDINDTARRELLKDYIRNEHDRRDVWIKDAVPDMDRAGEELAENYYLLSRSSSDKIGRQMAAPGGHKIGLIGPAFDEIIGSACKEPARLRDLKGYEQGRPRYTRAFSRLMASGQFHLVVSPDELANAAQPDPDMKIAFADKINQTMIIKNAKRLQGTQLVSRACRGASVMLPPMETILLRQALDTALKDVPAFALEKIKNDYQDKKIVVKGSFKKAADLEQKDIDQCWKGLTEHKLLNILRLGIARMEK